MVIITAIKMLEDSLARILRGLCTAMGQTILPTASSPLGESASICPEKNKHELGHTTDHEQEGKQFV